MKPKWTDLGAPPSQDDPGFSAWVEAFNAEADAWISECKALEETREEDIKTRAFIALVERARLAQARLHEEESQCEVDIGPPTKIDACEALINTIWECISNLRKADSIYRIAWYKHLCDINFKQLTIFSGLVPGVYYSLLNEEVKEAYQAARMTFNELDAMHTAYWLANQQENF